MTGRILQEDTSLLLQEDASAFILENYIGASGITTNSPVVSSTGISQVHSLVGSSVVTGSPLPASVVISQLHGLLGSSVVTQNPQLGSVAILQQNSLTGSSIASQAPFVGTPTLGQTHGLTGSPVASQAPSVGSPTAGQAHSLASGSLTTGNPVLGSPDLAVTPALGLTPIITGNPVVGSSSVTQQHSLSASSVTTGRPQVQSTTDSDWIVQQEIQELQQMFGGWPRRAYEVPDGRLVQAEREIEATFGEKVSVDKKAKSLLKFGKSAPLVAGQRATVSPLPGNEVYVQDNLIDTISSSSALDTQEIYLECHTVSGTGADQQFTFLTQTVTLNGQNKVLLDIPVARVSRVYNNNGTELVGAVYVYEDTAITAGVPNDLTKAHALIPQGFQQSFKAATTFSNTDYYILTGGFGSVSNKQAANVDFYLEVRTPGKVFRQGAATSASSTGGSWSVELDPAIIVPKNADVRITCEASANGAVVFGSFKGYLAKVL